MVRVETIVMYQATEQGCVVADILGPSTEMMQAIEASLASGAMLPPKYDTPEFRWAMLMIAEQRRRVRSLLIPGRSPSFFTLFESLAFSPPSFFLPMEEQIAFLRAVRTVGRRGRRLVTELTRQTFELQVSLAVLNLRAVCI